MARRALLCGINNYKSVSDLRGCLRDVDNMYQLLIDEYGFDRSEIRTLKDQEVTKGKLKKNWDWLMGSDTEAEGDTLVFHFSGHGSYVPDQEGEDLDGNDELLCLYDMDFRKPKSYLLDDELDEWIQDKPKGAELVVVTDCCHSGTNTRMLVMNVGNRTLPYAVDMAATAAVVRSTSLSIDASEVRARFLPPPDYVPEREPMMRVSRKRRSYRPYNHLHLAACKDTEVAADAPIDGEFHGAFTYHLCKRLRDQPRQDSTKLASDLVTDLGTPPYRQTPQVNGGPKPGPIFGGSSNSGSEVAENDSASSSGFYQQLLDAIRELTGAIATMRGPQTDTRNTGRRVVVYVHGISEHSGDYSKPWFDAMKPHVQGLYGDGQLGQQRQAVHWSDIVNARDIDTAGLENESMQIRQQFEHELNQRCLQYADPTSARDMQLEMASRGGGPQIDDFMRYLFSSTTRASILNRFTNVVRPLLAEGAQLDLITHSWGTVVAYEGLVELENEGHSGRVRNFFTLGSALSYSSVRWRLGLNNRKPRQIDRWYNLDAKGDGVGGSLRGSFPITQEFLDLQPGDCQRGWFGYGLSCAHSSYFQSNNTLVNRDILARHILEG